MEMPLLQIKDLSVNFITNKQVTNTLYNICLEVNKGELVAVVGESGSGKSVTSLSILQLLPQPPAVYANGSIILNAANNSIDVLQLDKEKLQQIRGNKVAMIFQEPMTSLNPVITCGHQITEALCLHKNLSYKEAKKQTIELFNKVQLPNPEMLFGRYPHQLSGGQKQRVAIGRALAIIPPLMLLDEPFSNLDAILNTKLFDFVLKEVKKNKTSVILITHQAEEALKYADEVAVLDNGKINQIGNTLDVYYNPKNTKLAGLLGAYSILNPNDIKTKLKSKKVIRPNQLKIIKSGVADIEGQVETCFFNGKCYEILINTISDNQILIYHSAETKEGHAIKLSLV